MKVLVTGATGQVARSLLEAGPRLGEDVIAVGRPDLDLAHSATIERTIASVAPDVVVSAGAYTAVDKAESEAEVAHAINAAGPGALAAICARSAIPVIHVSTDYVFDGRKAEAYGESDPTGPLNAYGRSKLEGEHQVARSGTPYVILRTAWIFSPFGHNFLKTMLRLAESRPEIGVVDDQVGNPTYAPHLAEAILRIARRLATEPEPSGIAGVYHAAAQGDTTWCGFAREIFRCSAALGGPAARVRPIATSEYQTPATRPANSRLSGAKLEQVLGLTLPRWEVGARECVARLVRPGAGVTEGSEA